MIIELIVTSNAYAAGRCDTDYIAKCCDIVAIYLDALTASDYVTLNCDSVL